MVPREHSANLETGANNSAEIRLSDLTAALRRRKYWFICTLVLSVLLAVIFLHVATYKYTVELVVVPVQNTTPSFGARIGGLANLAGIGLTPNRDEISFELYLESLYSRLAAESIARDANILRDLFPKEWSESERAWKEPRSFLRSSKDIVKLIIGVPRFVWEPPSGTRLQDYLERNLNVSKHVDSAAVTISIEHEDPVVAQKLLRKLHRVVDDLLRDRALTRTEAYIQYLVGKLETITIVEYRRALIETLSEQEKTKMVASSGLDYAADTFGIPFTSLRPTTPKVSLVLALSIVLGLFLGLVVAIGRDGLLTRL